MNVWISALEILKVASSVRSNTRSSEQVLVFLRYQCGQDTLYILHYLNKYWYVELRVFGSVRHW